MSFMQSELYLTLTFFSIPKIFSFLERYKLPVKESIHSITKDSEINAEAQLPRHKASDMPPHMCFTCIGIPSAFEVEIEMLLNLPINLQTNNSVV
jgi:hypothetical protein